MSRIENGGAGVILNRPSDIPVAVVLEAWEDAAAAPAVVHFGGPVATEHALALGSGLHREMVTADIGLVDLEESPDLAAAGSLRIFAGYAGWGVGQLETEIEEGSWFVVDGLPDDVLDPEPAELWRKVLARQSEPLRSFSRYPDDPRLN